MSLSRLFVAALCASVIMVSVSGFADAADNGIDIRNLSCQELTGENANFSLGLAIGYQIAVSGENPVVGERLSSLINEIKVHCENNNRSPMLRAFLQDNSYTCKENNAFQKSCRIPVDGSDVHQVIGGSKFFYYGFPGRFGYEYITTYKLDKEYAWVKLLAGQDNPPVVCGSDSAMTPIGTMGQLVRTFVNRPTADGNVFMAVCTYRGEVMKFSVSVIEKKIN